MSEYLNKLKSLGFQVQDTCIENQENIY